MIMFICFRSLLWQPLLLIPKKQLLSLKPLACLKNMQMLLCVLFVESQNSLATKADIEIILSPIKTDLAVLKTDSVTLKWMMGVLIAGVMSIIIKTFFWFNPDEKSKIPVEWSGVTIDISMNGRELKRGDCPYEKIRELIEIAQRFVQNEIT